ncbi:MAG: ABC transporter ATP-binding protein [Acidaminococcaceae bacterium]|nr:ABC transporter ATP-binding protein [Acidaminococcaceae bacterium]
MNSVVSITDFYFKYLRSGLVLKNINLEIEKGSFTVIIGPSGAGKTTLCKAMTGIVPYYSGGDYAGDVKVLGETTKGKKVSDLAMKVGLMLEDYESQLVSLTAGEEVAFSLLNHGFPPEEAEERTRLALADVGLPGRESYQLDELSGGQRQRLALASLLAVHPEIIVLDEPVSAMDPDGAESLYRLLDKIHKEHGTTFIVVEHRVEFVLPYLTDLVAVKNGEIAARGKCEDVVSEIYEDVELRPLLPDLWQVKCNLEKKTGQQFALWRSSDEAVKELERNGFGKGVRA